MTYAGNGIIRATLGIALVLVVGACTDGGDDAAEAQRELEQQTTAFAADYDRVAATYQTRVEEIRAQGGAALGQGGDAVLEVYASLREATVEAHGEITALAAPPLLAPDVRKLEDNLRRQTTAFDGVLAAAEQDDPEALTAHLEELASLLAEWGATNQLIAQRLARDG